MTKMLSLSSLAAHSRPADHPVIAASPPRPALPWGRFVSRLHLLRAAVRRRPADCWSLHTEDHGAFLLGLIALLQCGKEIHLPTLPPAGEAKPADMPWLGANAPWAEIDLAKDRLALPGVLPGDFPPIDPRRARLVFHTSGSTGVPKSVPKDLVQVENEIENLAGLWGEAVTGATFFSTVSPLHFYGFLFTSLFPFSIGAPVYPARIQFPESLAVIAGRKAVLVSSPAFLKRLGDDPSLPPPSPAPVRVFSSGGFLPESAAAASRAALGAPVHEIYGSTETGGIAWRVSPSERAGADRWTPFRGIVIGSPDDTGFTVASPYLPPPGSLKLEDRVEIADDGTITLLGRTDSVVKIEEKRVALNDVEHRLSQTGLVEDVIVLALEDGRQYLAAAVVLNRAGRERFQDQPKLRINRFFKDALRAYFEPLVIPRKWRFLPAIPRNPQGKIDRAAARALFAPPMAEAPAILDQKADGDTLTLTLSFPSNYIHFQGHFPSLALLPAVAQVDWAMKLAHRHLGLPLRLLQIPRFKCVRPIFPETPVRLELAYDRAKPLLTFSYSDPRDGSLYSQGKIVPGAAP